MTVDEARGLAIELSEKQMLTEEEEFLFTEAMDFLIHEEKDPHDMMELGGWYYERRKFDLALKYYEMAAAYDLDDADMCLGYIWYYGRTGERDYGKAFRYYSRCMERGNPVGAYKVADMYKNGYYVEKDYEKYKEIIFRLYQQAKKMRNAFDPIPEIYTRYARIRKQEGRDEEAVDAFLRAKDVLALRIRYSGFFGDLSIMRWLIDDLYELIDFDPEFFDFYDLFYVLKRPAKVSFFYEGELQELESVQEEGACVVRFNDKWYRDRDEFFAKAHLGDKKLTELDQEFYGWEAVFTDGDH